MMKSFYKQLFIAFFFNLNFFLIQINGQDISTADSITNPIRSSDYFPADTTSAHRETEPEKVYNYIFFKPSQPDDTVVHFVDSATFKHRLDSLMRVPLSRTDSLMYHSNPLFLPLVYSGKEMKPLWDSEKGIRLETETTYGGVIAKHLPPKMSSEALVSQFRQDTRDYITRNAINLYVTTADRLPELSSFMSRPIKGSRLNPLTVYDDKIVLKRNKLELDPIDKMLWIKKANTMLQFSQNYISNNWHQGGNSNLAFLSIFIGDMNYDNRKNVQWENKLEWRAGFNSVEGDTLRKISTNDDLLRYITKFGVKAGKGKWYYSIAGDISTQLFDSYKSINSNTLKSKLFTPVRANVRLGMDYKEGKTFSLMIAPITFKYIYLSDTLNINPNQFGVKKGKNQLKQLGSSLDARLNYSPSRNWDINSRFTFYTNFEKVEIDWEIVNNFIINRFLTTRLSLNPRYDSTVIMRGGEKARIQFKELLSIGLSFRFF